MSDFDANDLSAATDGWREQVLQAAKEYDQSDPHYDEVFAEVSQRLGRDREASKADVAVLTFWKRSAQGAWTGAFLSMPDTEVREKTGLAFAADSDAAALGSLSSMPGFRTQGAIATALLCAFDPVRFAVMDWRARSALVQLGLDVGERRGTTVRYLQRVRAMRDALDSMSPGITSREVDKGLFVLGGRRSRDGN